MKIRPAARALLAALAVCGVLSASMADDNQQEREDRTFYAAREGPASAEVKARLATLRDEVKGKNLTFAVGYTGALNRPLDQLAGSLEPKNFEALARETNERFKAYADESFTATAPPEGERGAEGKAAGPRCIAQNRQWDWRRLGKVTGIRDQDGCGSCWIFGSVGAFEASYLIINNISIDSSEQNILNCSDGGTCAGGYADKALQFLVSTGTATEAMVPYTAEDGRCDSTAPTPYQAVAWGWVDPQNALPSVARIKQAMCRYGPLACSVRATRLMQAYTGGIFNEHDPGPTNHTVCLVGWDDSTQAWLMRNSWGPDWGTAAGFGNQRGYMWIKYNSNSIGKFAKWVVAKRQQ